jgi:uncharacterized protein (DUF1697 family)
VTRYVALLRGVNVGGKNVVPMAELRTLAESLGYGEVRTFIQSGNVIFSASPREGAVRLRSAISARFGIEVAVLLRSAAELGAVLRANPFPVADPSQLHVGFMAKRASAAAVAALEPGRFLPEEFAVEGRELYLRLPDGMARTKLPRYLERQLASPITFRNWNTLASLAELVRL